MFILACADVSTLMEEVNRQNKGGSSFIHLNVKGYVKRPHLDPVFELRPTTPFRMSQGEE